MVLNHTVSIVFDCVFLLVIFILIKQTLKYDVENLPKKQNDKPLNQIKMQNNFLKEIEELSNYKSKMWASLKTVEALEQIIKETKNENEEILTIFMVFKKKTKNEIAKTDKEIEKLIDKIKNSNNVLQIQICLN